jgi:hypothetical protein
VAALIAIVGTPMRAVARTSWTTAQDSTRSIAGAVFDSLASRPLVGAHVHLAGFDRETQTDSAGRFRFDSVGKGIHGVWVDHPTLDSLGLYSLAERVDATPVGVALVTLAIPSFQTLWKVACGTDTSLMRPDIGFVFGHVHMDDPSRRTAMARIEARWRAAVTDGRRTRTTLIQRSAAPDSSWNYAVCGVHVGSELTIGVRDSISAALPVSFRLGERRMARHDLTLPSGVAFERILADSSVSAPENRTRAAMGAELAASVHDSIGLPLRDVRVTITGVSGEWRTDAAGAVVVRGIPPGVHVVTVAALGYVRERRLTEVAPGDSASLDLATSHLMRMLGTVTVQERKRFDIFRADLDFRKKLGFGYRVDSLMLARLPGVGEAFTMAPGIHVKWNQRGEWSLYMTKGAYHIPARGGAGLTLDCAPSVLVDGQGADRDFVNSLTKDEIGLIEIYTSGAGAPLEYSGSSCGVVLIWRKAFIDP